MNKKYNSNAYNCKIKISIPLEATTPRTKNGITSQIKLRHHSATLYDFLLHCFSVFA